MDYVLYKKNIPILQYTEVFGWDDESGQRRIRYGKVSR